jgi:hypothetical protein
MKKSLLLFLATICLFGLSGCYLHNEEVVFSEVRFYDLEGNEIIGEYKDYFDGYFNNTAVHLSSNFRPLNSAAPIVNFYCATIEDGTSVEVVMKFQKRVSDEITALILKCQDESSKTIELTNDIEEIDDYVCVTFLVENITKDNNLYEVTKWVDQDGEEHYFGVRGSNTYIRGFYFTLSSQLIPS